VAPSTADRPGTLAADLDRTWPRVAGLAAAIGEWPDREEATPGGFPSAATKIAELDNSSSPARTKDHQMTVGARARLALAGVVLVGLAVAACSAARSGTLSAARTAPTAGEQRLLVDTAPGYGANVSATPGYIVRYAYSHESSCQRGPASRAGSGRPVLTLHARWADDNGVIRLHRVAAAFNETNGFLINPFMIFWLSPPGAPGPFVARNRDGPARRRKGTQ